MHHVCSIGVDIGMECDLMCVERESRRGDDEYRRRDKKEEAPGGFKPEFVC